LRAFGKTRRIEEVRRYIGEGVKIECAIDI
jgi:hypothetical protein